MVTVGVDEVGRGCWAGPVVAGAVILGEPIDGLTDSKKLSKSDRQRLSAEIINSAKAYGIGWVSPQVLDKIGLTAAVKMAMEEAIKQVKTNYDEIIIDGSYNFFPNDPKSKAIPKADLFVPAVSAASIIAKVARDNYMKKAATKYPNYYFEKHVGYGTKLHSDMLALHGICELHRLSFKPVGALLQ